MHKSKIDIAAPYSGGCHRISLRNPCIWYAKKVQRRNPYATAQINQLLPLVISSVFGHQIDHQIRDSSLALDAFLNDEADAVFQKLTDLVTQEVLLYFPKLGAEIPESFYNLIDLDLYIYVPQLYEEQRGYFF